MLFCQSFRFILHVDSIPIISYLASPIHRVDEVVEAALAKLGIRDDPENYVIAKCVIPVNAVLDHCPPRRRGTFMVYDECPVEVLHKWDASKD